MIENNDYSCKTLVLHEDAIKEVETRMAGEEVLFSVAEFFKVLGDLTRVKILKALSLSELCVCDLAAIVHVSQSAVSHQLRMLRQANFVKNRKEGKIVYYSLYDGHIRSILAQGFKHIAEKAQVKKW